jgi:hypothetical protein
MTALASHPAWEASLETDVKTRYARHSMVPLARVNAAPQPRPEAGAQHTLQGVGYRRLFGPYAVGAAVQRQGTQKV